eukprot:1184651-Prorocentrum_minimum.AAC.2
MAITTPTSVVVSRIQFVNMDLASFTPSSLAALEQEFMASMAATAADDLEIQARVSIHGTRGLFYQGARQQTVGVFDKTRKPNWSAPESCHESLRFCSERTKRCCGRMQASLGCPFPAGTNLSNVYVRVRVFVKRDQLLTLHAPHANEKQRMNTRTHAFSQAADTVRKVSSLEAKLSEINFRFPLGKPPEAGVVPTAQQSPQKKNPDDDDLPRSQVTTENDTYLGGVTAADSRAPSGLPNCENSALIQETRDSLGQHHKC